MRNDEVPEMDDFAHHFDEATETLWTFGGYMNGKKTNALLKIDVNNRDIQVVSPDIPEWNVVKARNVPCHRTGARMVYVAKQNSLYIFGGLNLINSTLNDMWRYRIDTNKWELIA